MQINKGASKNKDNKGHVPGDETKLKEQKAWLFLLFMFKMFSFTPVLAPAHTPLQEPLKRKPSLKVINYNHVNYIFH